MPVARELFNDIWSKIQNRPRFLSFTPAQTSISPPKQEAAGGVNRDEEESYLTFKDNSRNPQYPISQPQYEGLTPHEYHQQVLEKELEKSQTYLEKKAAAMTVNKISGQSSTEPANADMSPDVLPPNSYARDVIFR